MSSIASGAKAFKVVIPARYASTRLEGKPLRKIGSKPLIQHVYENARCSGAEQVVVATDNEDIAKCIKQINGIVQMTSPHCASGSDRIAEAVALLQWPESTIVVNIQGDEPFLSPEDICNVANALILFPDAAMTTLASTLHPEDYDNPNVVKVITDERGMALQFSRALIEVDGRDCRRHLGVYAYQCGYLQRFTRLPIPEIERHDHLEQWRALSHGDLIYVGKALSKVILGIDTEEDLRKAEKLLNT